MSDIVIKKSGEWVFKGKEIIHPEILNLFKESLTPLAGGGYELMVAGDRAEVTVEDTPFFVGRVDRIVQDGGAEVFMIVTDDGIQEPLDLSTLSISSENVLYCRIKDNRFPARFHKRAYYQIAEFVEEDEGKFFLPLNGEKFYIEDKEPLSQP